MVWTSADASQMPMHNAPANSDQHGQKECIVSFAKRARFASLQRINDTCRPSFTFLRLEYPSIGRCARLICEKELPEEHDLPSCYE
jgi:hypothetical protein